jgi:hypothetical protein
LSESVKARLTDAPTCSIANADDIRETAISVFQVLFLLADSTGAANCNDRDFGMSRAGSCGIRLHLLLVRQEEGVYVSSWPIVLQKSKVAALRNFAKI